MTVSRPCDCSKRHRVFPPWEPDLRMYSQQALPEPIPAMHQHEDERCSSAALGIGGCPGLPHCRDWIIGAYNAGITMATVTGDNARAFDLRIQRNKLTVEFARRHPLVAGEVTP